MTSPPYWNQRDYEFEGQIGQEAAFTDYCERLTRVFTILREKLSQKGVFFLNIGDKYLSKYGNTPLGMIPYVLAHYMELSGWYLDEIIIWFKINHMPSSIKNRFTNTYEPVFVFAKNENNYHSEYRKREREQNRYTNVLKVNLQPTPLKHMAVYPEKLVESLLNRGIPVDGTICDPFAGSGTTGKAVMNLNGYNLLSSLTVSRRFIMIEGNKDYADIIIKRTAVNENSIETIGKTAVGENKGFNKHLTDIDKKYCPKPVSKYLFTKSSIRIIEIEDEKKELFNTLISAKAYESFPNASVLYLGFKELSLQDYYHLSQIIKHGWVIRNMLVIVPEVPEEKTWFPIFFIVKDQKQARYRWYLDKIRIEHRTKTEENWHGINFSDFALINNFTSKNKQLTGIITEIREKYSDGIPKKVVVEWSNGKVTIEHVMHDEDWWENLEITCPKCKKEIMDKEGFFYQLQCLNCGSNLWQDLKTIPSFRETNEEPMLEIVGKNQSKVSVNGNDTAIKKEYTGKFSDAQRINLGQSPGARVSTQEMFFSVARRYSISQPLVSDLLNYYRIHKKLSKKALTDNFPPDYLHTVGHWLRRDMGGSIPVPDDLLSLSTILSLPENFVNLLNRRGLKLQTVKKSAKGKNPGDFLEGEVKTVIKLLKKSML